MAVGVRPADAASGHWEAMATALERGRSLADACADVQLDRRSAGRLTAAGAGAWVELLDGLEGARVLLAEHRPGRAGMRIAREAALVGFAEPDDARAGFRRAWLGGHPADLMVGTEQRLAAHGGPWDVVIVDGLPAARGDSLDARLRRLGAALAPHGRLVVVADNRLSPLRAADKAVGRPAGPTGPSLRSIESALRRTGMGVTQRFGLLRSSADGVTAFDLDAPQAASAILAASTVRTEPVRVMALGLLRRLAERRAAALAVPAWMLVAELSPGAPTPSTLRPTGRLGHEESQESKVLRGEPPVELDKRCSTPDAAAREAMALRLLESCGLAIAPRLLGQPSPERLRQSWEPGTPLRPAGLGRDRIRTWVARAARTLGTIQRATERSDGSVLVHGDYWLGNLLVDGERVVSVLDWTAAHWGEPAEDLHHLVDHLVRMDLAPARDVRLLTQVARAAQGPA